MSLDARIEFSTYITASQWTQFLQMDPTARRIVGESDPSLLRTNGFADLRHFSDRCQTLGLPPSEHIHANSAAALLYRNPPTSGGYGDDHFAVLEVAKAAQHRFGGDLQVALAPDCYWFTLISGRYSIDSKALVNLWADPEAPVDPRPAYIRRLRSIWSAGGSETSGAADGN